MFSVEDREWVFSVNLLHLILWMGRAAVAHNARKHSNTRMIVWYSCSQVILPLGPFRLARSSYRRGRHPCAKGRCLGFRCCAPGHFVDVL